MSSTRRDFIKDAAITGVVVTTGTGMNNDNAQAAIVYEDSPVDETKRCPYFDQLLFCNGKLDNGKFLCEE